jgi:hypothetical protein
MPTINVPPNLHAWSQQLQSDDVIIIVGSERSPHDGIRELLGELPQHTVYMHPDEDISMKWLISDVLDRNDHHRHSLALLEAMTWQPRYILSLDDDNFPATPFWMTLALNILDRPNQTVNAVSSKFDDGWYDPGQLCEPRVVHRGFPHWLRHSGSLVKTHGPGGERIGVFASLWLGDPDIDATERIVNDPRVDHIGRARMVGETLWSVFNSQSTMINAELAPLYMMWPGVGRFDDIWASYLVYAYMKANHWFHVAGQPAVRQARNPHDLIKDLENEMFGYRHNATVIATLQSLIPEVIDMTPDDAVSILMSELIVRLEGILPRQTVRAFRSWQVDVKSVRRMIDNG